MTDTLMEADTKSASHYIAKQIEDNRSLIAAIGSKVRQYAPKFVMLVGRGSSDNAAVFAKYLIEIEAGVATFSAAPSVASVYGKTLALEGAMVLIISHSGQSPDIIAQAEMARNAGAYSVALTSEVEGPLKHLVDDIIPLHIGQEQGVTATKSLLATLTGLLQLTSSWTGNQELTAAVASLPTILQEATHAPANLRVEQLQGVTNLVVLGRGLGFAVAKEVALKLKEVCAIHAEAVSSAEFRHGCAALVAQDIKVIDVCISDESYLNHLEQLEHLLQCETPLVHLNQVLTGVHPRVAPLALLQRFYIDIAKISTQLGANPDEPEGLSKVMKTC
ncbi:SIS domain-containing protein [Shewanella sp. Scap07]|uniref:glucosamine-6-phosphate deaminase NagB-II n=1 Tax=Shewanella sp. Scap07 TaxID=2589987 RepID=UPI0015B96679|nr:SIS domain-containing protein [Shewanella sp. Scap07]QLE84667.1 SIS domain-containing protein [Shewanella sp. Scap07]